MFSRAKEVLIKAGAVLLAVVLLIVPMAVSAEYLTVDKYGFYNWSGNYIDIGSAISAGSYSVRWALSGVSFDYTYDCWVQITFQDSVRSDIFSINPSYPYLYFSNNNASLTGNLINNSDWNSKTDMEVCSIERVSDKSYRIHVYYNAAKDGRYAATMQIAQIVYCYGSGNVKTVSQGVGVYYDPGGNNYEEILQQINNNLESMPENIKDKLEEHDQSVKQEASDEGDENVGKAKEALEKALPIASIKDAITPLLTSLSYTGTTSVWTLPRMYIPKVGNLIEETELTGPVNFDLGGMVAEYEAKLPPALMMLVRSLLTAGLIVYCIKELIDLFREVFDK